LIDEAAFCLEMGWTQKQLYSENTSSFIEALSEAAYRRNKERQKQ
jgi:hypothetical protein